MDVYNFGVGGGAGLTVTGRIRDIGRKASNFVLTVSSINHIYCKIFFLIAFLGEVFIGNIILIQGVPLATEPGMSLIILPLMRILQRNLKRACLIYF